MVIVMHDVTLVVPLLCIHSTGTRYAIALAYCLWSACVMNEMPRDCGDRVSKMRVRFAL